MTTELAASPSTANQQLAAFGKNKKEIVPAAGPGQMFLAFRLGEEVYAIDILRIREIIEYSLPTSVPMMPKSLRGVINLRGAVVPVIDLSVRFGREPTGVGKRTCFVIVEAEHAGTVHILGLMVDGVNAVMEIASDLIEPPPEFGMRVNSDYISGMARIDNRFIILLDIARVLSIEEMAAIKSVGEEA